MSRAAAFPAFAALLLAGCANIPHIDPEVARVNPAAIGLDAAATANISGNWWTAFGDDQLDRLIAMGLAGNPDLDSALSRVRIAQAQVEAANGELLPSVNGSGQLSRAHIAERLLPPPIGGSTANMGIAVASLGWDLDLFGRHRDLLRQAANNVQAAKLDAEAARLAISVSIAQTYVGLAQSEQLIQVADGFVQTRQQALRLVENRVRSNLASEFDRTQAQTLLAEAQQARTRAVQQRDVLVHALAALAGRGAEFYPQIAPPALKLTEPPAVPDTLPADLLARRPDLLAGQARIEAALQGRKAAAAAFLPDVSITALAGFTAIGLENLVKGGAISALGGVGVSLPIFEGGKLRAQYRGATGDLDLAVASYNKSVLGAVREASDSITDVRAVDADVTAQRAIVDGLRKTVRLDQVRVDTGLGSRLDAVESGFRLLEAEQDLVTLQAQALARRIQLIAALGGGFDPAAPFQASVAKGDSQS
ncbi:MULTISPECIES: efflux transporter outer membrane subunit [Sphingobium]|uniref:efflux transporter outer membrane subunit n=1 Tax=Sphingobium TaxID=165695 RepID=UPI00159C6965|nr:efflux transporter outer membrane subunit [Sphingobium sp. 15-1]